MSFPTPEVSPYTQAVVRAVRRLYPESLSDKSFDNTGLLLEAPYRPNHLKNSALLTIDLTKAVVDEAITREVSVIVTYHPIIFRALKSITLGNAQQQSLLRLAQEGISVYSPHTAVDAAPGGLNDWLADIVTGSELTPQGHSRHVVHERSVIIPVKDAPKGFEEAGYGRIVRFGSPQKLTDLIERIKVGLGVASLSVACPQSISRDQRQNISICSIGICAGSGGSMLNGLDVDLLFTGELSHHEALAAIEQEKCVVTAFHSNSERAFLSGRMQHALGRQVQLEINDILAEGGWEEGLKRDSEVYVSQLDKDPFEIVT